MPLKLMFITNNSKIAAIADKAGVDWIFVDLEVIGKKERQGHLDTVISEHNIADIAPIKNVLNRAKIIVRINPINEQTDQEIEQVIAAGADIIMLPYYSTIEEVRSFIDLVDSRIKTCLLCETPGAVEIIDDTLMLRGIDFIHIGLNDLHLGYGMKFIFEPLVNNMLDKICAKLLNSNIKYGFGGVARLGQGTIRAEQILAEHYRLGSEMVILSRSFCDLNKLKDEGEIEKTLKHGIDEIREYQKSLKFKTTLWFEKNKAEIARKVALILKSIDK